MALAEPSKQKPTRSNYPLWIGFGVSAVWLALFVTYSARNVDEIASLQPNNLGDLVAGVFAPLAFLWLFVATLLQRQELELQRQELTETREVMALQKEEMKRAADENSQQTRIMTENLKQEAARIEYDRLDTILYSTALFIFTNRRTYSVVADGPQINRHTREVISPNMDPIDKTNSDMLFARINQSVLVHAQYFRQNSDVHLIIHPGLKDLFRETLERLKNLDNLRSSGNELIETRLNSLNFPKLTLEFEYIVGRL